MTLLILMDTGPLVALCDPRDGLNKTALRHLKALSKLQFAVCDPVLTEACFHLAAPAQRLRLQQVLDRLDVLPAPIDEPRALWNEVFAWMTRYSDHEPDLADAYLAVLCGRDPTYKVWTYDVEFRTIWRRPNGTAIPLATRSQGSL